VDNENEWTFVATRRCQACGGTGRAPHLVRGDKMPAGQPDECQTCSRHDDEGRVHGQERRKFTLAELKALLAR
jgi:hypothetical protein